MILALRQRHRRMITTMAVVLPLALCVGIVARKPVPTATLPAELSTTHQFNKVEWQRTDLFAKARIQVRLLREDTGTRRAVSFTGPPDFLKPDLLVYWVSGNSSSADSLLDNAVLLGAFDAPALPILSELKAPGVLILYSLADNEVVDVSQPIALAK